jgi:hypothetical protein
MTLATGVNMIFLVVGGKVGGKYDFLGVTVGTPTTVGNMILLVVGRDTDHSGRLVVNMN